MAQKAQVTGNVKIQDVPVERLVIGISFREFDDGNGNIARRVLSSTTSDPIDGSYTLESTQYLQEFIVLALDDYGEVWSALAAQVLGDRVRPTAGNETGYVYEVTIAGVSGETEPTWPTVAGDTVVDGDITYTARESWWPQSHAPVVPTLVDLGGFVTPLELDTFFNSVVVLLGVDALTLADDITAVVYTGTATATGVQTRFGDGALRIDSGQNLVIDSTLTEYKWLHDGTLDFTIEVSVRLDSLSGTQQILDTGGPSSSSVGIGIAVTSTGAVDVTVSQAINGNYAARLTSPGGLVSAGAWADIALARKGLNYYLVVNGSLAQTDVATTHSSANSTYSLRLGQWGGGSNFNYAGYVDNVRITKGDARFDDGDPYPAPTGAFPSTRFAPGREPTILDALYKHTRVLLNFEDGGAATVLENLAADSVALTAQGAAVKSGTQSNFGGTSLDVSGAGAYVQAGAPLLSAEVWTMEGFVRFNTAPSQSAIAGQFVSANNDSVIFGFEGNRLGFVQFNYQAGAWQKGTTVVAPGPWYHFAWVYDGAEIRGYLDGALEVQEAVGAWSLIDTKDTDLFGGSLSPLDGNVDDFRFTEAVRHTGASILVPVEAYPPFEYDPNEQIPVQ